MSEEETFLVRGTVRYRGGLPIKDIVVKAYNVNIRTEDLLGDSVTDVAGKFLIEFSSDKFQYVLKIGPDLRLKCFKKGQTEPIAETHVRYCASPDEKFTIIVPSTNETVWSEFDQIGAEVRPLLEGLKIEDLLEDENSEHLTYLVGRTHITRTKLRSFIQSHRLQAKTNEVRRPIEAGFFHGLLRGTVVSDMPGILCLGSDAIKQAINEAFERVYIPWTIRDHVNEYLEKLNDIRALMALGILGYTDTSLINEIIKLEIPDDQQRERFFKEYFRIVYADSASIEDDEVDEVEAALQKFWDFVKSDPQLRGHYDRIQSTLKIAVLMGGDLVLVRRFRTERSAVDPQEMSFIAVKKYQDWVDLLKITHGTNGQFPPGIGGATLDEKIGNYARFLASAVESSIPNIVIRERLLIDPMTTDQTKAFLGALKKNSTPFDFINTSITEQVNKCWHLVNGTEQEKRIVIKELKACQILYRMTRKYDALGVLKDRHITSAFDVVMQGRDRFVQDFSDSLKDFVSAETVYQNAHYIASTVLTVFGQVSPEFNKIQLDVLANDIGRLDGVADWPTFFGSPDYCQCTECQSVLSPSAYLVELFNFLAYRKTKNNEPVLDALFSRRPDLVNLELTCANTYSIIPYIDLVLEILENHVSPFGFVFSDASQDEAKGALVAGNLVDAIEAEFKNNGVLLSENARVVSLPDSEETKWFISDTNCRYCIVLEDGKLKVISRGFQTTESTEAAPISPVHTNEDAYRKLRSQSRPWSLPFNRPIEIVRSTLEQLKMSLWQLQRAFHASQDVGVLKESRILKELLSLASKEELGYLSDDKSNVNSYYPEAIANSADNRKLTFLLSSSGLSYADFAQMMKTRFVSNTNELELRSVGDEGVQTCSTEELELSRFNSWDAQRVHAFARLWRRLGWTMPELDQALAIFQPVISMTCPLSREILARIGHVQMLKKVLGIDNMPLLCLWGNIETHGETPYYYDLFNRQDLRGTDLELLNGCLVAKNPEATLSSYMTYLQGAFGTTAKNISRVFERLDDKKVTLENISRVYAHIVLADSLDISVGNLLNLIDLTKLNPFDVLKTEDTIRFAEIASALRKLDVDVDVVSYLVRHDDASCNLVGPKESKVTRFLKRLRSELYRIENENRQPLDSESKIVIDETGEFLASRLGLLDWPEGAVELVMSFLMGHCRVQQDCDLTEYPASVFEGIAYDKSARCLVRDGILLDNERIDIKGIADSDEISDSWGSNESNNREKFKTAIDDMYKRQKELVAPFLREWTGRVSSSALEESTARIDVPIELKSQLTFDRRKNCLSWRGILTAQNRQRLVSLKVGQPDEVAAALDDLMRKIDEVPAEFRMLDDATIGGIFTMKSPGERLRIVQEKFLPRLKQELSLNVQIKAVEEEFGLGEDYVRQLLEKGYCDGQTSIFSAFRDPGFITSFQDILPEDSVFEKVWFAYLRLHKAALLVEQFGLKSWGKNWLVSSCSGSAKESFLNRLPLKKDSVSLFDEWWSLASFVHTADQESILRRNLDSLFELLDESSYDGDCSKGAFSRRMADLLEWEVSDVNSILEDLKAKNPDSIDETPLSTKDGFLRPSGMTRVLNCLLLLRRLGANYPLVKQLTGDIASAEADACRDMIRAKYGDEDWPEVGRRIFDALREKQRNALTDYLVTYGHYENKNDLDEKLLIGTQMSACMETSRIVQAYVAVQRFVNRCFLGREADVVVDTDADAGWNDWLFLQNYRLFEANRKVFLFPENWIDPQLRDDKSSFFKNLESELLQNETTDETAEDAVRHYLESLDMVANLEVMSYYYDRNPEKGLEKDVLHVFARTRAIPHIYFYRRRIGKARWTAWEKVDLDIEGEHLIPVVWNRRLYLFWPVFTEMTIPSGQSDVEPVVHWNIQMAWSEYFRNKWSPKKTTKDKMESCLGPNIKDHDGSKKLHYFSAGEVDGELQIAWSAYNLGQLIPSDYPGVTDFYCQPVSIERMGVFHFTGYGDRVYTGEVGANPLRKLTGVTHEANFLVENESGVLFLPRQLNIHSDGIVLKRTPGCVPYRLVIDTQNLNYTYWAPFFLDDFARAYFVEPMTEILRSNLRLDTLLPPLLDLRLIDKARVAYYSTAYPKMPIVVKESGSIWPDKLKQVKAKDLTSGTLDKNKSFPYLRSGKKKELISRTGVLLPFESQKTPMPKKATELVVYRRPLALYADVVELRYRFHTFDLPFVNSYMRRLAASGVKGFFATSLQKEGVAGHFKNTYLPTRMVRTPYPELEVDFAYAGSYSPYNWELFFHIPFEIATKLSQNQQFEKARDWYHHIFNPTIRSNEETPMRYWQFLPFKKASKLVDERARLKSIVQQLVSGEMSPELQQQLRDWQEHPFNPHAIARMRYQAYMKAVVMKYLDNLIAWADQLFRSDQREAIEKAAVIYTEAADILGRRPDVIKLPGLANPLTFDTLETGNSLYDSGLKDLEPFVDLPKDFDLLNPAAEQEHTLARPSMLYFCIPHNKALLDYWDTIGERLLKIYNCQNFEGEKRPLRLIDPPIDPALLVRAAAAGVDLNTVLTDLYAPRPHYRFEPMIQFARNLCNTVIQLSGKLLATLEKRDAEALALLRVEQEIELQDKVRDVFKERLNECKESKKGLRESQKLIEIRRDYYANIKKVSDKEQRQMDKLDGSNLFAQIASGIQVGVAVASLIPQTGVVGPAPQIDIGGKHFGAAIEAASVLLRMRSTQLAHEASMYSIKAGHDRRWEEWKQQEKLAVQELRQMERQIAAADIRTAIAEYELRNHEQQMENSREVLDFMKTKFTNKELYDWSAGQLAELHFRAYQLAYDLAKQTERSFQYDVAEWQNQYVRFGHWDSLRKGLMAGERLSGDLDNLEAAFRSKNKRYDEHAKNVSLALLNPFALLQLKQAGECYFDLPEQLLDMDHPGAYLRRIKSISLTIPCVVGPYQNINAKLTLLRDTIRLRDDLPNGKYERQGIDDDRFRDNVGMVQHMRTSHCQNDSGQFEINYRDDRYLKFEGAGAVSRWRLELPKEANYFDFGTISDVIVGIRYTAREGKSEFAEAVKRSLPTKGIRMFSLKHNFSDLWNRLLNDDSAVDHVTTLPLTNETLCLSREYKVKSITSIAVFVSSREQAEDIELLMAPNRKVYDDETDRDDADYEIELTSSDKKYPDVLCGMWPREEGAEGKAGDQWMLLLRPGDGLARRIELDDIALVVEFDFQEA